MRLGGRIQAAIEVLQDIEKRKRTAADALKDWGLSHRFAGSGDRAAIGNIVYDALRRRLSLSARIDDERPHALTMATMVHDWGYGVEGLERELVDDRFAPEPLSEAQKTALSENRIKSAPAHVQADIPEWLVDSFEANFADEWIDEARALAARPPLDMRVNTLKSSRDKTRKQLGRQKATDTTIATHGLRIQPGRRDARLPNVQAEAAFQKGWFEVQDEGSQIVSELIFARPGENVLDYCAGAGGKTLAMAATMENKGQVHAHDVDKNRLSPIHERLKRAGIRNSQVHAPGDPMDALIGKMDRVVIDAPCTGTGTWRRRPDAKWRLDHKNLEERLREQEEVLSQAAPYVRPGGYLVYITCSLLPEENENQVYAFVEDNPQFEILSAGEVWQDIYGFNKPQPWSSDMKTITLTPASTGTDGFFFAVMELKK